MLMLITLDAEYQIGAEGLDVRARVGGGLREHNLCFG